jgi:hypothetical protein
MGNLIPHKIFRMGMNGIGARIRQDKKIKITKGERKQMNYINYIHDYEIDGYSVDFKESRIVIDVSLESKQKKIIFSGVFAYKFDNEMPYSIIFDLEEKPVDSFFVGNKDLLDRTKRKIWPVRYSTLEDLKDKIIQADVHYFVLGSSYGLSGWVLSEKIEIVDV